MYRVIRFIEKKKLYIAKNKEKKKKDSRHNQIGKAACVKWFFQISCSDSQALVNHHINSAKKRKKKKKNVPTIKLVWPSVKWFLQIHSSDSLALVHQDNNSAKKKLEDIWDLESNCCCQEIWMKPSKSYICLKLVVRSRTFTFNELPAK